MRGAPRARFGQWLNRSRRVLLTLWMVWVVSVFDFYFTLSEWGTPHFVEANPIAAWILDGPPLAVAVFKFGLLGLATVILLSLRRHALVEWTCWLLMAIEVYLAIHWFLYFDSLASGKPHPMIEMPP